MMTHLAAASSSTIPWWIKVTAGSVVELSVRYTVFAGLAWLLGYAWFKRRWFHRKVIARFPSSGEVWREVRYSALSVLIFSLVGLVTIIAAKHGWTQIYWKWGKHGWLWFAGSVIAAIFLHDAYFYWTHRLMHHPRLFRAFHRTHHLSRNPTPWAAYAFSPLEAVVEAGIFPLVAFLIPIHPFAFAIFMLWQIAFNVLGHTGYEIHPRWLLDSWWGRLINTPTNHIMHHEFMRGNYGLYFNIWDRLMGTNHEDYEKRFRRVTTAARHEVLGQDQA